MVSLFMLERNFSQFGKFRALDQVLEPPPYFVFTATSTADKARGSRTAVFLSAFASRCAVNLAPKANLITGPKLFAEARPVKYKPGTEDSKSTESTGEPLDSCT